MNAALAIMEGHDADASTQHPRDKTGPWRPPLTKILATVGPSIAHPDVVERMIQNGATLFRLNFSHGSFDEHHARLSIIRGVAAQMGVPVAVLGDLSGPKIRCRRVPEPGIRVRPGQDVILRADLDECVDGEVPQIAATYPNVATEVKPGHRVLINDGHIRMLCVDADGERAQCRVTVGGLITTGKGVNMPDSDLTIPALTDKDWACVEWGVEHRLDYFAMSFVRKGEEVRRLRARLDEVCTHEVCGTGLYGKDAAATIPIISKIETPQAIDNIDDIIEASDGIMVARGDLGVEMDVATVPMIQKRLVQKTHEWGRICIVATQMLESMVSSATPTRAEVSDVANAILDGADAVMLSAETAVGNYPHLAVDTMRRVAIATEEGLREDAAEPNPPKRGQQLRRMIPALAHGAWHMARDINAQLIVCWSQKGGMARYLSRNTFRVPILAFSSDPRAVRRMSMLYGVFPIYLAAPPEHRSEFAELVDKIVLERSLVQKGDPVILLAGKPLDRPGTVNTVAIRYAGEFGPEHAE
jgi:pyruvate kinase